MNPPLAKMPPFGQDELSWNRIVIGVVGSAPDLERFSQQSMVPFFQYCNGKFLDQMLHKPVAVSRQDFPLYPRVGLFPASFVSCGYVTSQLQSNRNSL
jgi:hypothetical protein